MHAFASLRYMYMYMQPLQFMQTYNKLHMSNGYTNLAFLYLIVMCMYVPAYIAIVYGESCYSAVPPRRMSI